MTKAVMGVVFVLAMVLSGSDVFGAAVTTTPPVGGVTNHGNLRGLDEDHHPQYLNQERGDARYYTQSQLSTSGGGALVDWDNLVNVPELGVTYHGDLSGLDEDHHPQYLNQERGDARYYTQSQLSTSGGGALVHWDNLVDIPAIGGFWQLTGNAGSNPGTDFLGTTDNVALELRVNNSRALRIEPDPHSPNLIGGYSGNAVVDGVYGAAISGGGGPAHMPHESWSATPRPNRVTGLFGTVGGGAGNQAGNDDGNPASAGFATVAGGERNTASGRWSAVGGGDDNTASGSCATVGGGWVNTGSGSDSTVGGGVGNEASGDVSTIGGGWSNTASGRWSAVGGGMRNTASDSYSAVGGGYRNRATGASSTIGGGRTNTASNGNSTVGGGSENTASGPNSTIGGGYSNRASHFFSTIGGGRNNTTGGDNSTVGGGQENTASWHSTVGGGYANRASGTYSTVGGGYYITASGSYATVPGGTGNNAAGDYSFAAGRRAKANANGVFAWADSTQADFSVTSANRFAARATGGVYFYTSGTLTTYAYLAAGSGMWASVSDRDQKENLEAVDTKAVLEKLVAVPITTWNYKAQSADIRHMGPVAQDLHAAFGLGDSDKSIGTIDGIGISMAAIQGLHQLVEEKDARIAELESRIERLEAAIDELLSSEGE